MLKIEQLNINYDKVLLKNGDFKAYKGLLHLIRGESGVGKTTLLYRIGLISDDHQYHYGYNDIDVMSLSVKEKETLRRNNYSFVFHDFTLFEERTIEDNLHYYAKIHNHTIKTETIMKILNDVHLDLPLNQYVKDLSGGECQRLEIACALLKETPIILLDEPTNLLDYENEEEILKLLKKIAKKYQKCIIITSHSQIAMQYADIIYEMKNQELICQKENLDHHHIELLKKEKIKTSFLLKNIRKDIYHHKKKSIKMIMILCLLMSCVFGIDYYLNIEKEKSIQYLESMCENQLFLTTKDNNIYVDFSTPPLSKQKVEKDTKNNKIYPYFDCKVYYGELEVDIIPYFDKNQFIDKLEYKYRNINDDGVILSQSVYHYLKRNNRIIRDFDEDIIYNQQSYHYSTNTTGVLKEGIKNCYHQNDYFIYMKYETLINLINVDEKMNESIGYTLFEKDFHSYYQLIQSLKEKDYDVNDTFSNIDVINQVIENTNKMKLILTCFSFLIINLMIIYVFLNHYTLKKKEYVIYKLSGLLNKDLLKMIFMENSIYVIISLLFISFVCFVCYFIFHYIDLSLLIYYFVLSLFIIVMCTLIAYFDMKHISIEQFLRN